MTTPSHMDTCEGSVVERCGEVWRGVEEQSVERKPTSRLDSFNTHEGVEEHDKQALPATDAQGVPSPLNTDPMPPTVGPDITSPPAGSRLTLGYTLPALSVTLLRIEAGA